MVNLVDTKVARPDGHFLSYELSKGALAQATRGLARGLAPEVRVNAVAPGLVLPSGSQTEADFERIHARTPLARGVKPEEIADDTAIMETLGVDSVSVFEIVVGLEEVYGISFEDDEFRLETFRTPQSIAEFVEQKLAGKDGQNDPEG